jgi:hypothetical protein
VGEERDCAARGKWEDVKYFHTWSSNHGERVRATGKRRR